TGRAGPTVQYATLDPPPSVYIAFREAVARTRQAFLSSVEHHLRSDVPVGVCLSGGIDSSSIICAMRHLLGPKADIHAFGYVSDATELNEEPWMHLAASASNATFHTVRVRAADLRKRLDDTLLVQDEPVAGTSILAQREVFNEIHKSHLKVVLDGQGADEL